MTLQEVIKEIKSNAKHVFDVLDNGKTLAKKNSAALVENMHGDLTKYFQKLASVNKTNQLAVQLYTPNGSSFIKKGFFFIELLPVVESTNSVETPTKIVDAPTTRIVDLSGIQNEFTKPSITAKNMSEFATKSDIENAQLKVEVKYLGQKVDELTERNKNLERQNTSLFEDHKKLLTEHSTVKSQAELDFKHKELQLRSEQKSGLNGIMTEIKELPPEAWKFLSGMFPNHPMNKEGGETQQALEGAKKHTDPDAQACIEGINGLLLGMTTDSIGKLTLLIEAFTKEPKHLQMVYDKFFPTPPEAK